MAAPLNTRNTTEECGAVRFLWAKVMAAKDIHKEMLPSSPLKQHLSGEHFPDDNAVERVVRAWFRQQPQEFYGTGFQGLMKRWDKCLNLFGYYYIEK